MRVAICIDNKNGMMFNHRRQSSDFLLCTTILSVSMQEKVRLLMSLNSLKMFQERMAKKGFDPILKDESIVKACDNYLEIATDKDICFVENPADLTEILSDDSLINTIDELIVYKWNTTYPYDVQSPFDLKTHNLWSLKASREFKGVTHPKITEERYINKCLKR